MNIQNTLTKPLEQILHEHKGYDSFWCPNPEDILVKQSPTFDFIFDIIFLHKNRKPDIIQLCRKEAERLQEQLNESLIIEEDEE